MDKKLRVLLVDDDEDEYVLLKSMFAQLPGDASGPRHHLDWSASYEQALEDCLRAPYDIILVDYHLGMHNGLDFMHAAAARGCNVPFILLTGQGSYELDVAAMQQGVYDYLLKDQINEYVLERAIRYALERKQAEEELETRVQERTRELAGANRILQNEIIRRSQAEAELREREAKLSESEARFRALAETTSAAIFIVQDNQIRYANSAARFVTGYLPEELVGMALWNLAHPDYQSALREALLANHWSETIPARYEVKIIHKRGHERWVDMTAGKMQYAGRPARVFTAFDITERDLAEQALRKARDELDLRVTARTAEIHAASQRLQTVLRTLPVGILIADEDGQIIEVNATFQELWEAPSPVLPILEDSNDRDSFLGWWSETGDPISLRDWLFTRVVVNGETILGQMVDILTHANQRKIILFSAVPIIDPAGRIVGGVAVTQDITHQRHLEQQTHLAAREAQQRADELEGLHRATAALLTTLDMDELLSRILDAARSALPEAENGMLYVILPTTGELQMRDTLGFGSERIRVIQSLNDASYPSQVIRNRKPLLVNDTHQDPVTDGLAGMLPAEMGDVRSFILAPLVYGNDVLGVLSLNARRPGAFTESNLRLLVSFAATTTAALQNAILHAEIKHLAVTDPLTGEFNRRAFFDLGQRELERYLRFNHPLTAVMLDLDNFKQINDTYGHAFGDDILRTLADRCRASIRETDIFGRYGGDEFALLLPDTDLFTAQFIAGRIRDAVSGSPWMVNGRQIPVSVSLGVARAQKFHHRLEYLLTTADKALYQAKTAGKNRVEIMQETDAA